MIRSLGDKVKTSHLTKATAVLTMFLMGCSGLSAMKSPLSSNTINGLQSNISFNQAKMAVTVTDASGNTVYSDSVANSSLILKAAQNYTINLAVTNAAPGTTYSMVGTNIDLVSSSPITIPLNAGATTFSLPQQGDFQLAIKASAPGYAELDKYYQADVTCVSPTFTAASLNANAITVTKGSGANNIFNYNGAGVIAAANGMAPYTCAWDPTGTGIVDTQFSDCTKPLTGFYVNYVGSRNVGLIVKDACNQTYTVSKVVSLPEAIPALGQGNVFISGTVTSASTDDSRVAGVNYLATNVNGDDPVIPNYGGGQFDIVAAQNYNMNSSVNFGMEIKLGGITDTINQSAGTGTVDVSKAVIEKVVYSTDESGDQAAAMSFSGSNCTLSGVQAKVVPVMGQPCSGGTSGDNNGVTVEVWGSYSCTGLASSGQVMNINGEFDGLQDMVDSCTGGGQGGGGVVPTGF
jgi:hypothetical protein